MSAQTIKTNRLVLRDIKKSDAKNIEYLLKPEIENLSGPYMPHKKNNSYSILIELRVTQHGALL